MQFPAFSPYFQHRTVFCYSQPQRMLFQENGHLNLQTQRTRRGWKILINLQECYQAPFYVCFLMLCAAAVLPTTGFQFGYGEKNACNCSKDNLYLSIFSLYLEISINTWSFGNCCKQLHISELTVSLSLLWRTGCHQREDVCQKKVHCGEEIT